MRATLVAGCMAALLYGASCGDDSARPVAADPSLPVTEGFPLYGPGPNWISHVQSGTVTFDADAVVSIDLNLDGVGDLTLHMTGTTTVFRSAALATDATRPRRRTHLDLEIVSLTLATPNGVEFRAGDGAGNFAADGPLFSIGTSDEIVTAPQLAHDDFAIFFAGNVAGLAVHNEAPLRMVADIDRLPPIGSRFQLSGPPLPLFLDDGSAANLQITAVSYTPLDPNR
jgi:hypothetical protein